VTAPFVSAGALGRVAVIVRKELVDILRDRRTMLVTLVTAIAAGPLILLLLFNLVAGQAEKAQDLKLPAGGLDHAPALAAFLVRQQVTLLPLPADYEARIRAGDLDVALEVEPGFAAAVASGRPATVRLVYDRSRDRARAAIDQAESLLRAYNREWGRSRLLLFGVSPDVANPLDIERRDLATPQSSGSLILFMVAYYGLLATLIGGLAAALDTTAGERERMSLEPLLTTPASPLDIVAGKWLAIVVQNAAVVALTLGGFYLTLRFAPLPAVGIPFLFGAIELARFAAVLLPLALLAPAALVYVGGRGRTMKEAQSNVSVLLFVVSVLPFVQMTMQQKEPWWLALVPVSGQYGLLARALRGDALPIGELALSYVTPLVLALVALALAARTLARESTLAGR
jgi:sodium transport system permease protein